MGNSSLQVLELHLSIDYRVLNMDYFSNPKFN